MNKLCVREWKIVRGWMWLAAMLGFVGGVGMTAAGVSAYHSVPTDLHQQQRKMVTACELPDVHGAMTVFVLEDGKLKCWRWK